MGDCFPCEILPDPAIRIVVSTELLSFMNICRPLVESTWYNNPIDTLRMRKDLHYCATQSDHTIQLPGHLIGSPLLHLVGGVDAAARKHSVGFHPQL